MSATPSPTESFAGLDAWLEWLETLHPKKIDLSLGRIGDVLGALGLSDPQYRVVTVGGTNGKGSCVAILESIYSEAGYSTGAYTSPHLWRFNERLRIDGREATDSEILSVFREIEAARDGISLSYFEYTTVAAISWFARNSVDVAVLEVGLGGRLDAVNAVDPDASLIVSIDLDHQSWLGNTREDIAKEKAGIMRPGRPVVVAEADPPATLSAAAEHLGATLALFGRDFDYDEGGDRWRYLSPTWSSGSLPKPGFGGDVQLGNAAACLAVVRVLRGALPVDEEAIERGIANSTVHGRAERHEIDGVEWIFDVAHNPAAARVLASELLAVDGERTTYAVFAAMADKDVAGLLQPFIENVGSWTTTRVEGERAADEASLRELLLANGASSVACASDVVSACRDVRAVAVAGDRVIVFGSCYIVGPAMSSLGLYSAPSPLRP